MILAAQKELAADKIWPGFADATKAVWLSEPGQLEQKTRVVYEAIQELLTPASFPLARQFQPDKNQINAATHPGRYALA